MSISRDYVIMLLAAAGGAWITAALCGSGWVWWIAGAILLAVAVVLQETRP